MYNVKVLTPFSQKGTGQFRAQFFFAFHFFACMTVFSQFTRYTMCLHYCTTQITNYSQHTIYCRYIIQFTFFSQMLAAVVSIVSVAHTWFRSFLIDHRLIRMNVIINIQRGKKITFTRYYIVIMMCIIFTVLFSYIKPSTLKVYNIKVIL